MLASPFRESYATRRWSNITDELIESLTRELPAPLRKELPSVEDLQEVVTKLRSEMDYLQQEQHDE